MLFGQKVFARNGNGEFVYQREDYFAEPVLITFYPAVDKVTDEVYLIMGRMDDLKRIAQEVSIDTYGSVRSVWCGIPEGNYGYMFIERLVNNSKRPLLGIALRMMISQIQLERENERK